MKPSEPGGFPKGVAKPAIRALVSIGVHDLAGLARHTEAELMALHGMGPKALCILQEALRQQGMQLRG